MFQAVTNRPEAAYGHPVDLIHPLHSDCSFNRRAVWIKALAAGGTLAGLALSPRLWVSYRDYPLSPVASFLAVIPPVLGGSLLVAFIALLLATLFVPRPRRVILGILILGALLVCLDQSRLQPWFYQYLLLFISIRYFYSPAASAAQRAGSMNACRLIVASIYIWSGIQKLNPGFADDMFPWLVRPLLSSLSGGAQDLVLHAGYVVPFVEVLIGLGLLSNFGRRTAVLAAIAMHCFLLLALGPVGHDTNTVVWAWNIVMIGLIIALFAGVPPVRPAAILSPARSGFRWLILFAATVAPAMSLFGIWDHYASWALYSGARDEGRVYLSDAPCNRLPEGILANVNEGGSVNELDISRWSARELNVPVYPEPRVYINIAKTLCRYSSEPSDVRLEITSIALLGAIRRISRYDCSSRQVASRLAANSTSAGR